MGGEATRSRRGGRAAGAGLDCAAAVRLAGVETGRCESGAAGRDRLKSTRGVADATGGVGLGTAAGAVGLGGSDRSALLVVALAGGGGGGGGVGEGGRATRVSWGAGG